MNNYLPYFKDVYQYKDRLQLESWQTNNYMSADMKQFYLDMIHNMQQMSMLSESIANLNKDVSDIKLYLDSKNLLNDFSKFQRYMMENPFADIDTIRAFFRKQKIEKILNGKI